MDIKPDVGFAAGEIYFCGIDTPVEVGAVKKKIKKNDDIFYMALGWLAREGKIEINRSKAKTYVRKTN
ncbi:MAG: winged helix-turn-helix domain-containing protein [Candidatus Altiarchaeota archaeon]